MYIIYGVCVYGILDIEKPSKSNFFSLIVWHGLFKFQVLIIALIFNVNSYNRHKSIESYYQNIQEPEVEIVTSTTTTPEI
jgi:hypothetical protein